MKGTFLTVHDGLDSIGGNKILLETGGIRAFLDFGINFKKHSCFFAEFLKPRSTKGVHDLLQLGLIPELPIYREDLVPSDLHLPRTSPRTRSTSPTPTGPLRVRRPPEPADHRLLLVILKGMQDVKSESPWEEVVYFSRKERDEGDSRMLTPLNRKPLGGRKVGPPNTARAPGGLGGIAPSEGAESQPLRGLRPPSLQALGSGSLHPGGHRLRLRDGGGVGGVHGGLPDARGQRPPD